MKKQVKNWVIYVVACILVGLLRCMSLSLSLRVGGWLGRRVFRWAKAERETTFSNLRMAFMERGGVELWQLGRSVFEHFGMAAAEYANVRRIRDLAGYMELDLESRRVMDDMLALGRGVVFVTGHCGNWELMARALAGLGYPINTIGKKSYDPRFTRMMERFRREGAVQTIWRGEPGVMQQMRDVLRRGEVMGLLIDQDTRVPGVFVPFFGKLAYTPTAPAHLARLAQAPVVCGFNHRLGHGGYHISIEAFELSSAKNQEAAILQDTARLTDRIETHIRQHPDQWVWLHRRWKTRPTNSKDNILQVHSPVL